MMRWSVIFGLVVGLGSAGVSLGQGDPDETLLGRVRVGMVTYAGDKTAECFSDGFLSEVARVTSVNVDRRFWPVRLDDDAMYGYPFVVMGGTGGFELSEEERERLGAYLRRGGFVLASAGCSDAGWGASFAGVIEGVFGEGALRPVGLDHPVFHMVYEVERLTTRRGGVPGEVYGLWIGGEEGEGGRLAVLFSPTGLHDTGNAGGGCCCCGGNEFLDSNRINANVLVYALTH